MEMYNDVDWMTGIRSWLGFVQ